MNGLYFFIVLIILVVIKLIVISISFREEIEYTKKQDPAAPSFLHVVLLYSGPHAVIYHRICHALWNTGLKFLARWLSQTGRFMTGIEIHPAAVIGKGLFIDHGMGVVIGETSILGDNVTLFQGVTLGGTGKECGKRHPTLGNGVVVGAGAKVLGNIKIGDNSYIGANAVVLKNVPANSTVVGVPGRLTKQEGKRIDIEMDHIHVLDPVTQQIAQLKRQVHDLEKKLKDKN